LGENLYGVAGQYIESQVTWAAENVDWFNGVDPSCLSAIAAVTNAPKLYYDEFGTIIVGSAKWEAALTYCQDNGLAIDDFLVHYAVETVVDIDGEENTLPAGSRVPYWTWVSSDLDAASVQLVCNVASAEYREFNQLFVLGVLSTGYDGVFDDNCDCNSFSDPTGIVSGGTLIEYPDATSVEDVNAAWTTDVAGLFSELTPVLHAAGKVVWTNNGDYVAWEELLTPDVLEDGIFREFVIDPTNSTNGINMYLTDMAVTHAANVPSVLTGTGMMTSAEQINALAMYYILADPSDYFLREDDSPDGGCDGDPQTTAWFGAIEYNVGAPSGATYVFATGSDPSSGNAYTVFARQYASALVLYKPFPVYGQTPNAASATTHQLDGSYQPLSGDGTLGAAVTSVSLENGTGFILCK
jgi:hypothetical protein